ncbi:MAG: hypothetical protein RL386_1591, partial [Bacteroidota bacterium]
MPHLFFFKKIQSGSKSELQGPVAFNLNPVGFLDILG